MRKNRLRSYPENGNCLRASGGRVAMLFHGTILPTFGTGLLRYGIGTLMTFAALMPSGTTGALQSRRAVKSAFIPAASLHVPDLDGHDTTPLVGGDRRATVLLFITNDCPIANSYAPEIQRIQKAYAPRKFAFYLVYVDPDLSLAMTRKHWQDYAYNFPALLDRTHALAKQTGATITPEAAVVSPSGKLLYRGRIDDRYVDFGKARAVPTTRDLRAALDAIVRGKPVPHPTTRAIGCFLPPAK